MNLKLACADFTFPLLTHDQSLDLIAMLGFEGVDIGLFEGRSHVYPSQMFEDPERNGRQLGKTVSDRGLLVADVFLQTGTGFMEFAVNHPEPARRGKARDWFSRSLDFAGACQCSHVTALPGVTFPNVPDEQSWDLCCEELAWRAEQAASRQILFGVEAHIGSIAPTPEKAKALVQSTPGLTLTLDYTHFTSLGVPDREIEPLVQYASHFHVRGARKDRLQASFNQNTVDYSRVVEVMRQTGYNRFIGIEYVWIDWQHCNEVDNLSETILMRDFLRQQLGPRNMAAIEQKQQN